MINLSEVQQLEIANYFGNLIVDRKKAREELVNNLIPSWWDRHLGKYSSKKDKNFPFPGAADFHIPFATFADTMLESRFVNGIFSTDKIVEVGVKKTADKEAIEPAKRVNAAINEILKEKIGVYNILRSMFQGLIVEGTRFLKIMPERIIKKKLKYKRKFIDKVLKLAGYERDEQKNMIKEMENRIDIGYKWEEIEIKNLLWDKNATSLKDAKWIAQRLYMDKYDLIKKKKNENWINVDELYTDDRDVQHNEVVLEYQGEQSDYASKYGRGFPEIYEIWGEYAFGDEEISCQLVIELISRKVLYIDNNPLFDLRKPYVDISCYRISKRVLGQGVPQRISLLNDELDTTHNITIDNGTLCNAFTFLYVPYKGFDPSKITIAPGRGIPVQHLDNTIKQLKLGNPTLDLYKLEDFVISLLEKVSLISDYSLGRESAGVQRPTARGTLALIQQSAVGINHILMNVVEGLKEGIRQTLDVMYEFMPSNGIRYGSDDVLMREDLEYRDDFEIIVLSDAIREIRDVERNTALMIHNLFAQDQSGEIDTYGIKKYLLEKLDPQLAKQVVRTPAEIQQMQQAMAAIAQKQQELDARERDMNVKEGQKKEQAMEGEMREAGIDEVEINKRKDEFREKYLDQMEGEGA